MTHPTAKVFDLQVRAVTVPLQRASSIAAEKAARIGAQFSFDDTKNQAQGKDKRHDGFLC